MHQKTPIRTLMSAVTIALLAGAVVLTPPATAQTGTAATSPAASAACDPAVQKALEDAGRQGTTQAVALIRDPARGIRQPESILDFSCIVDLLRTPDINILFDPNRIINGILRAVQDTVCEATDALYARHIGDTLDDLVFSQRIPRLPGLDVSVRKSRSPEWPEVEVRAPEAPSGNKGRAVDVDIFRRTIAHHRIEGHKS